MKREDAHLKRNVISLEPCFVQDAKMSKLINQIFDEHEAQIKAKDEEIKDISSRAYHAEGYICDLHNNPSSKKFYDKKARSIVAMLFWEWRKLLSKSKTITMYSIDQSISWSSHISHKKEAFEQAYKMIKESK